MFGFFFSSLTDYCNAFSFLEGQNADSCAYLWTSYIRNLKGSGLSKKTTSSYAVTKMPLKIIKELFCYLTL